MAKLQKRKLALQLRQKGKSYSEIKSILGVSKGTLSLWLREYPLSEEKIRELRDWNQKRIEHYIETRRKKKEVLLKSIYEKEKKYILPLSDRELFIAGLFLYWGEGAKTKMSWLSLSNSDPLMIKFFLKWIVMLGIPKEKIGVRVHLYKDMKISSELKFWSKTINISLSQFKKPYIKKSNRKDLTYKSFGHGTCNLIINDAVLARKILMGLQVIRDSVV